LNVTKKYQGSAPIRHKRFYHFVIISNGVNIKTDPNVNIENFLPNNGSLKIKNGRKTQCRMSETLIMLSDIRVSKREYYIFDIKGGQNADKVR
jgi:hypothetical protein